VQEQRQQELKQSWQEQQRLVKLNDGEAPHPSIGCQ
jgi:hypothetical protein